ncbi:MAG: dTDP-4-dehydrorhamnose reductase [Geodermatophilaceae bacterium]|nr:dTDP-4-dehydrorhamnose reductase [Geodermatophilaceae bacterium]MDQ3454417.1 dTDP-4-dehydrorhamnose reductase [Actinomycetota bacterium]
MMRWLVTGAGGQLGRDLLSALAGEDVTGLTRRELDLTDEAAVRARITHWVQAGEDGVIVNAAAYTAVDAAETDEGLATVVNGHAPGWISAAAAGRARLMQLSTDYVFDGTSRTPYRPEDPPSPATAYGRSKLLGESAVLAGPTPARIVRTAWVFSTHGGNFVDTMLRLETERETVQVVDDQHGSPTWSAHLARGLVELGHSAAPEGIYHCTGGGVTTWHGLARAVFEVAGADPDRVQTATSAEMSRAAPRPAYSVLSNTDWVAAGLTALPDWRAAVRDVVRRIRAERGSS